MPKSLPRLSVPRLDKCFPWSGKKESNDAGVIHQIDARALENPGWRQDTANAEDMHLTPTSSTHELAVFLRTTGPRGRESHRAPFSTRRRSKSLPRRLLGQLRNYWKLTPDDDVLSNSTPYTWDKRLQAWVRGEPQQSSLAMSDSVMQRTTSKGSHKYMELKVPSISRANAVFSIGRDCNEKPLAAELDLLTFRDLTSDELMDGWLAELRDKVDSCSESAGQESPPWPTISAISARLSLLLPSTQTDDSVAATRERAQTRASSSTTGRLSIWTPAVWSRDSTDTIVRHTGSRSGSHEYDRQAGLCQLEDVDKQDSADDAPTGLNDNVTHGINGGSGAWRTPPQCPESSSSAWIKNVPFDRDQSSASSQEHTSHTSYASDDSDLDTPAKVEARQRRDTKPASGRTVEPRRSYRSSPFVELAYRGSAHATQTSHPHDHGPGSRLVDRVHRKVSIQPLCSPKAVSPQQPSPTMRYIAPKYLPEARDFFMRETEGDAAHLSHATISPGFQSPDDDRLSRSTDTTRPFEHPGHAHAACPMPYTYRITGRVSSEVDLTDAERSQASRKHPPHVQSEELLGRACPNAWNQTKPLRKPPTSAAMKMGHISLSRSIPSLRSQKTRPNRYAQAPTPPPEKELPALPRLLSCSEHPGIRGERARVSIPPQPGTCEPSRVKRKPIISELPPTPTLCKAQPYNGADLRVFGAQHVLRPAGDSACRLADMEMLEGQLCEIQSKVIQLSSMVVEILTKQY
ncbi:hypothetical protein LTS12_026788 [Elasticomyces elasticus]|nr:hypothetical protein LTS12_026788 [Elasticomyces elasticus]